METSILETAFDYGLAAVALIALFFILFWVLKSHTKERSEWRQQSEDQYKNLVTVAEKTSVTVEQNTNAVQSLEKWIRETRKVS